MDDYPTKSRSNEEVQKLAKKLRRFFKVLAGGRVDVLACLKNGTIWTVRGMESLVYKVRPDSEMGADDAVTTYAKGVVTITARESVNNDALMGKGRARNTLIHELGHAVMHDGAPKARQSGAVGKSTPKWWKPFKSTEHQTKVFAPAFLIDDELAETFESAKDISIFFGVSLESAQIRFDAFENEAKRIEAAERIAGIATAFGVPVPDPGPPKYLKEPCPRCGHQTLRTSDSKYICATCKGAIDRFQDGDSFDP